MGNYLDTVECGVVPMEPRSYQLMANKAQKLLESAHDCPLMLEAVANSPALRELRSNIGMARAIQIGLLDLPQAALRALHQNPA